MTVYVDTMQARHGRLTMCHMLADTDDELHAMADRIGVARRWHQKAGTHQSHFGADFSPCRTWRYRLWREWNPDLPKACFVLMNPSTADELNDDPTVARCQRRVAHWTGRSIGGVVVVNVFAWRETDSQKLPGIIAAGNDIVGPGNDAAILSAAKEADIVVCGWGIPGNLNGRGRAVEKMLRDAGITLHHLKLNSDGSPQHPLYIGYAVQPQAWEVA